LHRGIGDWNETAKRKFAIAANRCLGGGLISSSDSSDLPACAGCGRCCHQVVELVAGVDVVPEAWVVEHDGVRCLDQRGDGACVGLDAVTQLCTIYETRPQTCREFERGGGLCRAVLERHDRRVAAGWLAAK
jgi:Fe-S-cluster containining protein